jgi:phage shock protein PspC (stress-responsive transcriptional regulator)
MQNAQPSLFTRDDTLFGVCEALGEDLGFNPLPLRIALGVLLLWNPVVVVSAYFGAGVLVMVTRWAFPNRRPAAQDAASEPGPLAAQNDDGMTAIAA